MTDVLDDNSENVEVATQEIQNDHEEPSQSVSNTDEKQDRQERNWREMRRKQAELERELLLHKEMNERLLRTAQQSPQVQQQEVDELDSIGDDDYLPKGKSRKFVAKEMAPLKKEIEDLKHQLKQQNQYNLMSDLRKKYSDFEDIVNSDTLALLEEQEPELAQTIVDLKDPYKIGMQSYKYIKAMNLAEKTPELRRSREVEKKLEKNSKTVQTPQAYDKRPMAQAFKMTDAEKSQLYQEMMGYASQSGFSY